ncbi:MULTISPECIES: molybdopterin-dependent oxidoreductase [Thermococcus]|uniref:Oxidoreductase molybdopterin binding n=1 Tax=Thermococcus sibiricus (strain DSM 12597 / MM 739) TaxID=604354 RepID=C6A041_THESM|nr:MULTISPECIES: molybdopterin-dependent oxidoreductase [Thermococcus]ACS91022.1 oxidoreductase molybdopterin binding [Thermococcus sibiricus MM 739]MCO6042204.1 molybdopterin-dependent oxidoreductase [Thermococcus alcaliphilus]
MKKKLFISAIFLAFLVVFTVARWNSINTTPSSTASPKTENFSEVSSSSPEVLNASEEWVIEVTGLVEKPMNITLSQLKEMPQTAVFSELYCVAYPGKARKQGLWKGVKLSYILEQAGVKDGAIKVAFYARDGFTTDLTLEEALTNDELIIAYEFNNKPIEPRLIAPGMWGYKWIKYLVKIEVVDYNFLGTYESEGYPDDAYIGEKP